MSINCVVIDDDSISIKVLSKYIDDSHNLSLTKSFTNSNEALDYLNQTKEAIDLVFLDVEMPKLTGIELIKSLKQKYTFIIVSAKKKYSYDAIELNAVDFLSKPISQKRFEKSILRFQEYSHQKNSSKQDSPSSIFVKSKRVWTKVKVEDILYIKANNTFISIYTSTGNFHINTTMKEFLEQVKSPNLIRVHRSYIVNTNQIEEIKLDELVISDKVISISKSYMPEVLASLTFVK